MSEHKRNKKMFLEAYDSYASALYRHCYFHVYSEARAEELVQETFLKTWQYLERGNKVENMKAFLYRVANNLIIDNSRKKKEESLEALQETVLGFEPSSDEHIDISLNALTHEIKEAMESLPESYKEIIVLRYIDDMTPKEIAELLNTTANTVSVKINRAIKLLREVLGE
jgi:RNA polymerase sigma-70 factor (ECF subfamily)